MSFNFSSTAGTSGVSTIHITATTREELTTLTRNYTLANSGSSILMPVSQEAYAPEQKYLIMTPSDFSVDAKYSTGSLNIQSNDDWVLVSNNWIGLSRLYDNGKGGDEEMFNVLSGNGNTIVGLIFYENAGSARTGFISGYCVSDSSITATTNVIQSGVTPKPYITLSSSGYSMASSSASTAFTVSSNTTWNVTKDSKWITLNTLSGSGNGSVSFAIGQNTDGLTRRGLITVYNSNDGISAYFTIEQAANEKQYIFLYPSNFQVDATGSTGNVITVSANCSYDIDADVNWITLNTSSGSGNGSVSFSTLPTDRIVSNVGNIVFSNSAVSSYATVERMSAEKYLSASTSSLSVNLSASTTVLNVYSNLSWETLIDFGDVSVDKPWITVSPSSGKSDGTITVTVTSAATPRNCTLLIYNKEYGLNWPIKVAQRSGKIVFYEWNSTVYYPEGYQYDPKERIFDYGNAVYVGAGYDRETNIGYWEFDRNVTVINRCTGGTILNYFKNIEFPYSVKSFGNNAFSGQCSFTELVIPDSTTGIGANSFGLVTEISQPSFPTKAFVMNNSVRTIGNYAFRYRYMSGCTVEFPNTLTSIGQGAFNACHLGGNLVIPSGVTAITQACFANNDFKSVNVGDGVRTIAQGAFSSNEELNVLVLGRNVTSLGNYVVEDCNRLEEIYSYNTTPPTITSDTFYDIPSRGIVHYPAGSDYSAWQSSYAPNYHLSEWTFKDDL